MFEAHDLWNNRPLWCINTAERENRGKSLKNLNSRKEWFITSKNQDTVYGQYPEIPFSIKNAVHYTFSFCSRHLTRRMTQNFPAFDPSWVRISSIPVVSRLNNFISAPCACSEGLSLSDQFHLHHSHDNPIRAFMVRGVLLERANPSGSAIHACLAHWAALPGVDSCPLNCILCSHSLHW